MRKNVFVKCLIIFNIILIFGCSDTPENNIKKEYYVDGKLKSEVPLIQGKEDGLKILYDNNGNEKAWVNVKNDLKDGYSYFFYSNGTIKSIEYYQNDVAEGDFIWFDEKRNLSHLAKYQNDITKSFKEFDSNGNVSNGSPYLTVECEKDTIKWGETYAVRIHASYALWEVDCNLYVKADSTKENGDIYKKIGDCEKAIYTEKPLSIGEHQYKLSMLQILKDEKGNPLKNIKRLFIGKYWVVK